MKHHQYNPHYKFIRDPLEFNKYSDLDLLQYCLGATLYMPGNKKITQSILGNRIPGLTSMVMCFEDAIDGKDLPESEENVLTVLKNFSDNINKGFISEAQLPLFFVRVRNFDQFKSFSKKLTDTHIKHITGFVFPKFNSENGHLYLNHLKELNNAFDDILYGMPILEGVEIAYKETRDYELSAIRTLLKSYRDLILNIRVGATDLSSAFGVRRGIDYSIYDILMVRDCLSDILNFLGRSEDGYVLSAPVWEYFLADKEMKFQTSIDHGIHQSVLKRNLIVNEAVDGLLREVILDKANGFVGKTIIHPSHLKYVNGIQAVTSEEYEDAVQILENNGGVLKSSKSNKMNEMNPHRNWAKKTLLRAKAYGVIEDERSYFDLFSA